MQEKQSHKCNCGKGRFSSVALFLAAFLVIPLILSLLTFNIPSDTPSTDEPTQDVPDNTTPDVPDEEEVVLDTTGFVDYTLPYNRVSLSYTKYGEYNLSSSEVTDYEITDSSGSKFIEYSGGYANSRIAYFDSSLSGKTTQDCNGVLISFDIATDYDSIFERLLFVLRNSNNDPLGSAIPFNKVDIPTLTGKWQHVILNYNFRENTCDVYIDGEKTSYTEAFPDYIESDTYKISQFRFMVDYESDYLRTYIDNFAMKSYDEFSDELLSDFETCGGKILDVPVAYVDGVAYYNYKTLKEALTGDTRKDVVIVAPYKFYHSSILISCPVRIKNHSQMTLSCSSDLECIGEKDGIYFYDYKITE